MAGSTLVGGSEGEGGSAVPGSGSGSGSGRKQKDEPAVPAGESAVGERQSAGRALGAPGDGGDVPRRRRGAAPQRRRVSLAGKATAAVAVALVAAAAAGAAAARYELPPLVVFLVAVGVGLPLAAWLVSRILAPLDRVVRGVADGIRSFHDHDFSVRLAYRRGDELGELVRLYNEVGQLLQEERHLLRQRELLLETALERSPAAILLVGPTGRIVYSNREACHLLLGGAGRLEGRSFAELRAGCPPEMEEVLASDVDGLFAVRRGETNETFHLSRRTFQLNYRRHELVLLRRLTGELGRQEAATWKKVLRIVSHELNNSLAPISSLVHSARVIASDPRHAHRADEVFDILRERLDHLQRFLEGYARFARLPRPQKERVTWEHFAETIREFPLVRLLAPLPAAPGWFDPAQMRQVLVNLIKNAMEANPTDAEIGLRVETGREGGTWIQISDPGPGMDEDTMRQALLPFYSTKPGGSGLGLALCREILEAHGGKLSLQSRPGEGTVVTCWLPPG
jgi:two-component system, NtrC family, nitrogen regulation sensor histidine kinase NtrY